MNVGILSWMIDRKRTGVNNYLYNLIKNIIKNGKANEISLIHYEESVRSYIFPSKRYYNT